jgi:hypothetical protein
MMPDDGNPPQRDEGSFERLVRQLGVNAPEVIHELVKAFVDFEANLPIVRELRSDSARKWFKSVSTASGKLADLLEKDVHRVFGTAETGHPWSHWVLKQLLMGTVVKELLTGTHTMHSPARQVSTAAPGEQSKRSIENLRRTADPAEDQKLFMKFLTAMGRAQPQRLIEDLRRLADAADDKDMFPEFRSKKRREWPLHHLIRSIAVIYEDRTGNRAGRSTDPRTNKPGGPFFRIVRDAYSCLGISKGDDAIALDIRKALKGRQGPMVGNRGKRT